MTPPELYAYLDGMGISYEVEEHAPVFTIDEMRELGIKGSVCKNLFLRNAQRTQFYLLLMPGDKKFKTAVLSKQIGSARLSFAEPEFMLDMLDITPGSVSVLGLMNDKDKRVRLLIDEDVLKEPVFACHPCISTSSLRFATSDLIHQILPALNETFTTVKL